MGPTEGITFGLFLKKIKKKVKAEYERQEFLPT